MRIIPGNHHFKPSFDPVKRKASPGKEGKISSDKDKFHDRLEISHPGDTTSQSSHRLDDQYKRYPVSANDEKTKVQDNHHVEKSLLEGAGLTDDRMDEIRQQISAGMYESVVVQKTVADMITRDLLKI